MHLRYRCLSALVLAAAFLNLPAIADQATSVPLQTAQGESDFNFWNSIKDSKKAEDYQSYLDKYPNGNFAELAKLRMKKYAAVPAPKPAPAPAPAAVDPLQADIAAWNSIKASKNADDYRAYLEKYPNGEFADVAKLRVEQLSAPAAATVEPPAPPASPEPKAAPKPAEPATTQSAPPEPEKTPSAVPKPAQRLTFEAKDETVYARDGGQVRAKPDPKAALVVKLEPDTEVQATGLSSDRRWWRVEIADGRVGYMHHSVVSNSPESVTEPTMPLPATTPPTLPATTPSTTPLPSTTQPTLPATTSPATTLPATTPPASQPVAKPRAIAPGNQESSAKHVASDEEVCPKTSQVEPDNRVAACERLVDKTGSEARAKVAALGDLAAALVQAQRYDEAILRYKQAAALAPRDARIYYNIGLVRLGQLRFPEARAAFDKAAQFDPENPDFVFLRGIAYAGLGEFDTAKLEVKSALVSKEDAAYYEKLGEIEMARGDLDAAKVALERGRKVDAGRRSLILAVVNYYVGDTEAAAAQLAANSDDPTAALWSALIKKAQGDAAGAAEALTAGRAAYRDTWAGPIFDALSGTLDIELARAAAQSKDGNVESRQLCTVNTFAGEWAYLSGDKEGARAALQAALATRAYYTLEFAAAKARLANMGG
jgi:Flp pilus assembly protein TadD